MFKIVEDRNARQVFIQISNLDKTTNEAIRQSFYMIGKDLVSQTREIIMEKPKHGKLYKIKRSGRLKLHRASAPGEAPANFTGSLRKSIGFDVVGSTKMVFGAREARQKGIVGNITGVQYGKYLEEGTRYMSPRPYLEPIVKKNYTNIETAFKLYFFAFNKKL